MYCVIEKVAHVVTDHAAPNVTKAFCNLIWFSKWWRRWHPQWIVILIHSY